jgi:hypothetical protein
MSKSKNSPHVDRAVPVVRLPKRRTADMVTTTASLSASMKQSPDYAQATAVQTALASLEGGANDIAGTLASIKALDDQLVVLKASLLSQSRKWQTSLKSLLGAVEVFGNGSVEVVKSFALEVRSFSALGLLAAPVNLTLKQGKDAGTVQAKWTRGNATHGFVVQHATDPANPATFSTPQTWTKSKYTLGGLPSGSNVYFRVAAVDPRATSALGPFAAWASGTAR